MELVGSVLPMLFRCTVIHCLVGWGGTEQRWRTIAEHAGIFSLRDVTKWFILYCNFTYIVIAKPTTRSQCATAARFDNLPSWPLGKAFAQDSSIWRICPKITLSNASFHPPRLRELCLDCGLNHQFHISTHEINPTFKVTCISNALQYLEARRIVLQLLSQ